MSWAIKKLAFAQKSASFIPRSFFPEKVAVYTTHILGIVSIIGIILFLVRHGI